MVKHSLIVLRRIATALSPSLLVVIVLGILSFVRIDLKGSNGIVDTSYPIRASELLFLSAAVMASLGSSRLRRLATCFLICALATLFVLHFVEMHRQRGVPRSSLITSLCSDLFSHWNGDSERSFYYVSWNQPEPRYDAMGPYFDSLKYYAAWWIAAVIGCSQDLFQWFRRETKSHAERRKTTGSWSISLKGFLILVTLAAWTFGVLQMPLGRQRYAAITMLVVMTMVAAVLSGLPRRPASAAGKTWLLVAGIYLGFLFIVRGDGQAVDMLDPCLSPTMIEIVFVPFYEPDEKWDWWYRDRMDNYSFLYDARARAYTINGTSLICVWLASVTALLRYRLVRREERDLPLVSASLTHPTNYRSIAIRLSTPIAVLLLFALLTVTGCFLTLEQGAHFSMKLTEAGFLGILNSSST